MDRQVRWYRALLRAYPRRFRDAYRDEMTRLFADQLRDARSTQGVVGVVGLWARSLVDLVVTAPRERVHREELAPSVVGSVPMKTSVRTPQNFRGWTALSLLPVWVFLVLNSMAPGLTDPIYAVPPAIVGLPAGYVVSILALAWAVFGTYVGVALASKSVRSVVLLVFTAPSLFVVVAAQSAVLVVQQLAV